jgi:membrane associated rhomboid family serine protease
MRPARGIGGGGFSFGGRVPRDIGALIAVTVVASLLGAIGERNGFPLFTWGSFLPDAILRGEVWRLVTWIFLETDPLRLLFGALALYWFGRDLALAWGPRRFLGVYFGLTVLAALLTLFVALVVWPEAMMAHPFIGNWPLADAMLIAWALLYPDKQILLFFVLPVSGRIIFWITLLGTVAYAAYGGFHNFVPHLAAEVLMIAYCRGLSPRRLWLKLRLSSLERSAKKRARHLKVVEGGGEGEGKGPKPPKWLN